MAGETRAVRYEGLHNEHAAVRKMPFDVGEAPHLILLRGECKERVEDDEDQPEVTLDVDVPDVANHDGDVCATGFCPELRDHGLGDVDTRYVDSTLLERKSDASGADR